MTEGRVEVDSRAVTGTPEAPHRNEAASHEAPHTNEAAGHGAPDTTEEYVPTVVVGGGQAGLVVGYHVARRGLPFVILDDG